MGSFLSTNGTSSELMENSQGGMENHLVGEENCQGGVENPQHYGMISAHLFLPCQPRFPTPFFPILRWSRRVFPSPCSTEPHFTTTRRVSPPFPHFYFTATFPFIALSPSLRSTESHFTQPAAFPPLPHVSTSPHLPA